MIETREHAVPVNRITCTHSQQLTCLHRLLGVGCDEVAMAIKQGVLHVAVRSDNALLQGCNLGCVVVQSGLVEVSKASRGHRASHILCCIGFAIRFLEDLHGEEGVDVCG